jgi:hypothetical protein
MNDPFPDIAPPPTRRCAVCGENASFGFGTPGNPAIEAEVVLRHREEGERAWTARYRPTGGFGDQLL